MLPYEIFTHMRMRVAAVTQDPALPARHHILLQGTPAFRCVGLQPLTPRMPGSDIWLMAELRT
jgi:hypothetical protein